MLLCLVFIYISLHNINSTCIILPFCQSYLCVYVYLFSFCQFFYYFIISHAFYELFNLSGFFDKRNVIILCFFLFYFLSFLFYSLYFVSFGSILCFNFSSFNAFVSILILPQNFLPNSFLLTIFYQPIYTHVFFIIILLLL